MEEIKPVTTPEAGGAQAGEGAPAEVEFQSAPVDLQAVSDLLDASDKAIEKAEKKIVALKRNLKSGGEVVDDEVRAELDLVKAELAELRQARQTTEDSDVAELQAMRKKNQELRASLIAQRTVATSTSGSNQDVLNPEEDLTKSISTEILPTLEGYAEKYGMTLKEVAAHHKVASSTNQPLGLYLRQIKKRK